VTKVSKTGDSLEQPSAARRALLTGGAAAAGLAAFAGGAFAEAPPADAASTYISISDWINVLDNPYGANAVNDGSTECSGAINSALSGVGGNPNTGQLGGVVYMPAGTYLIGGPLKIPTGVTLLGAMPVGPNQGASTDDASGTILQPVGNAGPGWSGIISPGVIYINGPDVNHIQYRTGISNLWIDATKSTGKSAPPVGLAGIGVNGGAYHGTIFNVGIRSMPGNGLWFTNISGTGSLRADGWIIDNVILQSVNLNQGGTQSQGGTQPAGVYWYGQDSTLTRVHVQANQANTLQYQAGFYLANANNCRFIACRADQNGDAGWVIDSNPGGTPNSPGSTIALVGCGTENNGSYGLRVVNTSSNTSNNNDQPRTPVVCTGCSFDFDGNSVTTGSSTSAGVFVQGICTVELIGCDITTNTVTPTGSTTSYTFPQNGLVTAKTVTLFGGNTGSGVPQWIRAVGGIWNCNGSSLVVDAAGANPIIDVGAVTGGPWIDTSTISLVSPVVSGQYLCQPVSYAPGTQAAPAVSSATMGAFDSVHLKTGPFTAPPSGDVVVTASFTGAASAAGVFTAFGLATHGTVSPIVGNEWVTKESASTATLPFTVSFLVTGLTPGNSYNFDLLGACTSGDTFTIYAIGQSSTTPTLSSAGQGSPVVITVEAV
jgi:hypothetical protein